MACSRQILIDRKNFDSHLAISRGTFNVQLDAVTVSLKQAQPLPLEARQTPEIVVLGRKGRHVRLQAQTSFKGMWEVTWAVTGGAILDTAHSAGPPTSSNPPASPAEGRITWRLPDEPGTYQIEVVMDYGSQGIGFDVLRLEVSSDE